MNRLRMKIVTPAKIELTTPRPMLERMPAASPTRPGSVAACFWISAVML
jgi:hypothetical protein